MTLPRKVAVWLQSCELIQSVKKVNNTVMKGKGVLLIQTVLGKPANESLVRRAGMMVYLSKITLFFS
jgi:hypothetical protein